MESDSVRTMGDSTLVDLWIEGKFRAITVSRQAIESYLGLSPEAAQSMGETDRREFVRTHLGLVVGAATSWLRANPEAETIVVDSLNLSSAPVRSEGERRSGDRRKGERRKINIGPPGGIERRRS
ncbi:MAG TPA: hypothetical protein VHE36_10790 [Sphingomicrobium sp.]|nr:hypothetical protein [Sphingomicrobium sp.]